MTGVVIFNHGVVLVHHTMRSGFDPICFLEQLGLHDVNHSEIRVLAQVPRDRLIQLLELLRYLALLVEKEYEPWLLLIDCPACIGIDNLVIVRFVVDSQGELVGGDRGVWLPEGVQVCVAIIL